MGVWIEIYRNGCKTWQRYVTPLVGVWIEIARSGVRTGIATSLPLWECGLKL